MLDAVTLDQMQSVLDGRCTFGVSAEWAPSRNSARPKVTSGLLAR